MATKNNFSKAVLDLMGLPGNENHSAGNAQNAVKETVFDQKDMTIAREPEAERETESEGELQKFLYNVKTAAAVNTEPVHEENPATVISRSMVIVGEITSGSDIEVYGDVKGSIKVDGDVKATGKIIGDVAGNSITLSGSTIQGNITAQGNVTIGFDTVVIGDITAENIKLNGKVKGNLKISKISEFQENALLAGDVYSQTISMSQGAKLHGNVSVALDSTQSEKEFDSIFGMLKER